MKFTLSWLKEHLETDASLEAIAGTLTMVGLEVEGVENLAETLEPFKAARVLTAEPHPNADKLRVCTVETEGETLQVVCGAPNARAGMIGVFAPVGTTVPGTGLELKPTAIRGVKSNGMLVSEREMGLSDAHEGIIELPETVRVGTPMAEVLGLDDPVIEIAITPNRPDCLGVGGVARDLAAAGLGTLKSKAPAPVAGGFDCSVPIAIEVGDTGACTAFAGRVVRGVKNGPSPDWLQRRLRAIGLRPINALVDITNFIAYDRGRPLHVYDAAKLTGTIRARMGRAGEKMLALDGKEYDVDETMCVIADDARVLGLGGVIGGEYSGSTEETTTVLIESACFDPVSIATTGRKLNINSDARYRFERGIDPAFTIPGLDLATQMVLDLCGGEASGLGLAGTPPEGTQKIAFDPALVRGLTGLDIAEDRTVEVLAALGFRSEKAGAGLVVTAPSWRPDISGAADLVEEVTRIEGLDKVPSTALPRLGAVAVRALNGAQDRTRRARRALAARGLTECVTWSFIPEPHAKALGGGAEGLRLLNPISADMSDMRPSPLAGLLAAAGRNRDRGQKEIALFEVGPAYSEGGQTTVAAGLRLSRGLRHWENTPAAPGAFDAKGDALALLAAIGAPASNAQAVAEAPGWYHPGRSGRLQLGPKTVLGTFGEVHPLVLEAFGIEERAVAFEVTLENVPPQKAKRGKSKGALEQRDLLPLERDFAFVLDEAVAAQDVVRAVQGAERALIAGIQVFDVYRGAGVEEGKKSLALAVTLQPKAKTLTDEEIDAVGQKIIAAVGKATGGTLRG